MLFPMVVLTAAKTGSTDVVAVDGTSMPVEKIILTDNFSWKLDNEFCKYFEGEKLTGYTAPQYNCPLYIHKGRKVQFHAVGTTKETQRASRNR